MSSGSSYFGDPWDGDDPSQPPSFFGGELRNVARWQSAGWGNPLLALAGQRSYPGSLLSAGMNLANLAGPPMRLAANAIAQPDGSPPSMANPGPMASPPYGPVPDEIKAEIGHNAEDGLERAGHTAGIVGPIMGKVPGLEPWGAGIEVVSKFLEDQAVRAGIAGYIRDWMVNSIQDEINRANNAYGQQQFLNGGGMPHR